MEEIDARGIVLARPVGAHSNIEFAIVSSPSIWADALVAADLVPASGAVQARIGGAVVDIDLASCTGVAFPAVAEEFVVKIDTSIGADRAARIAKALVDLSFALETNEAGSALAEESFELIDASCPVLARFRCAVVDGVLTLLTGISGLAGARVTSHLIQALTVVPARLLRAFVYIDLAGRTAPAWIADALVIEEIVDAYAIETGISGAQIYLLVATLAGESRWTVAGEVCH